MSNNIKIINVGFIATVSVRLLKERNIP